MGMFNFVLDSFKGEIFGFKVKRQDLIAGTVHSIYIHVISYTYRYLSVVKWQNGPGHKKFIEKYWLSYNYCFQTMHLSQKWNQTY